MLSDHFSLEWVALLIERAVCNMLLTCFQNLCESFLITQEVYDMNHEGMHISIKGKSLFISVCVSPCLFALRQTQARESSFTLQ